MTRYGLWLAVAASTAVAAVFAASAGAASIVVTAGNAASLGWVAQNVAAGTETWTEAFGAPPGLGSGALEMTTTASNSDKAFIATDAVNGTSLSAITNLSYWTYRNSGPSYGAASLQVVVSTGETCTDGNSSWTTLVYEPYWNTSAGAGTAGTVPSDWTEWSITPTSGVFWSSHTTCGGSLHSGAGGAPFYTLSQVLTAYPNATVLGLGVDVGTYNPGYDVAIDGVTINDTTYDFEVTPPPPTDKNQCKKGGWQSFGIFKNQGDCVSYVATQGKNPGNG